MADTKISNLPVKPLPEASDILPIVDSLVNYKVSLGATWDAKDARFSSPSFTYTGADLTRIDYSDGSYKVLTYSSGKLSQVDFQILGYGTIIRKTFIYSGDTLIEINETLI